MATVKKCTEDEKCTEEDSPTAAEPKPKKRRSRRKSEAHPTPDPVDLAPIAAVPADQREDVTVEAEQIYLDAVGAERDVEDEGQTQPLPIVAAAERIAHTIEAGVTVFRERKTAPCTRFLLKELLD